MVGKRFIHGISKLSFTQQPKKDPITKKSRFIKDMRAYFKEYCDATGIHGFRYLGESRSICEKIWWLCAFIGGLILCAFSILSVYEKWDTSPVIVTFATRAQSISEIPFPAITVCSESKVKYSAFDYGEVVSRLKTGENLTKNEKTFLNSLSYICDSRTEFSDLIVNNSNPENFLDTLREISPNFTIINCKFLSAPFPCEYRFIPVVTDEGICYTFNILDRDELFNEIVVPYRHFHKMNITSEGWSPESGYKEGSSIAPYPQRALLPGAKWGLKFELKTENDKLDTMCRGSVNGYRILLHVPIRVPRPSQQYTRVPYNTALSITIRPSQILTSAAVRNYPAEKRQCFFPSEKKLKYFKIYSQNNCDMECLTNYTLSACHCVLFYMPRENNTRICNAVDYTCTRYAEIDIQFGNLAKQMKFKEYRPSSFDKHSCDCLPMCNDVEYKVGSSQSVWNWSEELESGSYVIDDTENITNYHLSKVTVYFMKSSFIGSERNELYGPTDFIANVGGLLGLFTGFSVLSILEIVYFLSIRLVCNIRLFGNWAG